MQSSRRADMIGVNRFVVASEQKLKPPLCGSEVPVKSSGD
jgi:hypothetical protein